MKTPIILGGVWATIVVIASAVAIAGVPPTSRGDADGDGALNKAEVMAIANGRFAKMDANNDGQIDATDRTARQKARFEEIDADKNGSISADEFAASRTKGEGRRGRHHGHHRGHGRHGMALMKLADANGDKAVTKAEVSSAIASLFEKADANRDGKISSDEHMAARKLIGEQIRAAETK